MQRGIVPIKGEIIIYPDNVDIEIKLQNDTIWLTQKQIATLFKVNIPAISKHINRIYTQGELSKESTVSILETVQKEAGKDVSRKIEYYNLDLIISIGYRVNSNRATQFRIWTTKILKDHIVKGYTMNQKRLAEKGLTDFEEAVKLIKSTIETRKLSNKETQGLLSVVTDYAFSWVTLQKYDEGTLDEPKNKRKPEYTLTYEDAVE